MGLITASLLLLAVGAVLSAVAVLFVGGAPVAGPRLLAAGIGSCCVGVVGVLVALV